MERLSSLQEPGRHRSEFSSGVALPTRVDELPLRKWPRRMERIPLGQKTSRSFLTLKEVEILMVAFHTPSQKKPRTAKVWF